MLCGKYYIDKTNSGSHCITWQENGINQRLILDNLVEILDWIVAQANRDRTADFGRIYKLSKKPMEWAKDPTNAIIKYMPAQAYVPGQILQGYVLERFHLEQLLAGYNQWQAIENNNGINLQLHEVEWVLNDWSNERV